METPPDFIKFDEDYRLCPFIVQAAKSGSIPTYELVKKLGGDPLDSGCIFLSKKMRNEVVSNAIGCAAYHGNAKMLMHLLENMDPSAREFRAREYKAN